MNDKLIDKLSKLELEEKSLKRNLDRFYCNEKVRTKIFNRLKIVQREISNTKFKLRIEKEIRNEK